MRFYRLRTWFADLTVDHAVQKAVEFAGQSGAMLATLDLAITALDRGETDAARRFLQDTLNEFGENCRAHLDNYQPPVVVVDANTDGIYYIGNTDA